MVVGSSTTPTRPMRPNHIPPTSTSRNPLGWPHPPRRRRTLYPSLSSVSTSESTRAQAHFSQRCLTGTLGSQVALISV